MDCLSTKDRFLRYCVAFHHLSHSPQIESLPFAAVSCPPWSTSPSFCWVGYWKEIRGGEKVLAFFPTPSLRWPAFMVGAVSFIASSSCWAPSSMAEILWATRSSSGSLLCACPCALESFAFPACLWVVSSWKSLHLNYLSQNLFPAMIWSQQYLTAITSYDAHTWDPNRHKYALLKQHPERWSPYIMGTRIRTSDSGA